MKGDSGEGVGGPADYAQRAREINRDIMRKVRAHSTAEDVLVAPPVKRELPAVAVPSSSPEPPAAIAAAEDPSAGDVCEDEEGEETPTADSASVDTSVSVSTPTPPAKIPWSSRARSIDDSLQSFREEFKCIASGMQDAQSTLRSIASSVALIAAGLVAVPAGK